MDLFLSYTRTDSAHLPALLDGLKRLRHQVWYDQELSGGQQWWDEVLARIRGCDALVLALTPEVLESQACALEVGYARALGKPVIPVMVLPVMASLLPPGLAQLQMVDFTTAGQHAAFDLMGALAQLTAPPPLPDPLPDPPPVPVSYLSDLGEQVQAASLTLDQQLSLVGKLRFGLNRGVPKRREAASEEREREAVLAVMRRLRARDDLYYAPARELDRMFAEIESEQAAGAAGPTTAATGGQPGTATAPQPAAAAPAGQPASAPRPASTPGPAPTPPPPAAPPHGPGPGQQRPGRARGAPLPQQPGWDPQGAPWGQPPAAPVPARRSRAGLVAGLAVLFVGGIVAAALAGGGSGGGSGNGTTTESGLGNTRVPPVTRTRAPSASPTTAALVGDPCLVGRWVSTESRGSAVVGGVSLRTTGGDGTLLTVSDSGRAHYDYSSASQVVGTTAAGVTFDFDVAGSSSTRMRAGSGGSISESRLSEDVLVTISKDGIQVGTPYRPDFTPYTAYACSSSQLVLTSASGVDTYQRR